MLCQHFLVLMKRSLFGMVAVVCSALVLIGLGRYLLRSDHDTAQTIPYHRGAHPPLSGGTYSNYEQLPTISFSSSSVSKSHNRYKSSTSYSSHKSYFVDTTPISSKQRINDWSSATIHTSSAASVQSYGVGTISSTFSSTQSNKPNNNYGTTGSLTGVNMNSWLAQQTTTEGQNQPARSLREPTQMPQRTMNIAYAPVQQTVSQSVRHRIGGLSGNWQSIINEYIADGHPTDGYYYEDESWLTGLFAWYTANYGSDGDFSSRWSDFYSWVTSHYTYRAPEGAPIGEPLYILLLMICTFTFKRIIKLRNAL